MHRFCGLHNLYKNIWSLLILSQYHMINASSWVFVLVTCVVLVEFLSRVSSFLSNLMHQFDDQNLKRLGPPLIFLKPGTIDTPSAFVTPFLVPGWKLERHHHHPNYFIRIFLLCCCQQKFCHHFLLNMTVLCPHFVKVLSFNVLACSFLSTYMT